MKASDDLIAVLLMELMMPNAMDTEPGTNEGYNSRGQQAHQLLAGGLQITPSSLVVIYQVELTQE